jgi:hypothetical protein
MFHLTLGISLFALLHILVWFSANLQFVDGFESSKIIIVSLILSIPTTLCAFYASRATYIAMEESLWSVRFIAFGISYLVFPFLTWIFLNESMFTFKTIVCVLLSVLIVCIQVFL